MADTSAKLSLHPKNSLGRGQPVAKGPLIGSLSTRLNNLRPTTGPVKKVKRPWQALFAGSPVLILVLILHALFAAIAAYLIVSSFTKERKKQFTETAPVATPHKEVEHWGPGGQEETGHDHT